MGNSSSNDKETTNTGKKPTGKPVLKLDYGAPANTNVFLIYTGITPEYLIKVLSSINYLSRTGNYTIIVPGFQITTTLNKTRFSIYTYNITTNSISKDAETIDKIDIPDLQATITKTNTKCTILTDLPRALIEEKENLMSFTRDINQATMPEINISIGKPDDKTDKIIDCYINDWTTFEIDQPSNLIGTLVKSKLFQEDAAALPMYTFSIEKFNINKMYKDNKYYFLIPKNLSLFNMIRHLGTVGQMKNTCTNYILPFYSGQTKNVMDTFIAFYKTQYDYNFYSFYIENQALGAQKYKCISINVNKRSGNIITFNGNTLDLWDYGSNIPTTKTNFYNTNFKAKTKSAIYGKEWTTNYTLSDPPSEIFASKETITPNPVMSYIYYHLNCGNNDFYLVPLIINDAKERLKQDPNYKGLSEKFTLIFSHNSYDEDTEFKNALASISFLRVVPLATKNMYVLTNIENEDSILSNYYFTVSINIGGDQYKYTVDINGAGTLTSFFPREESKASFLDKNPITTNKGLFFSRQIVQVPADIINDKNNIYTIVFKDPVEATVWNFCRQCIYKNMWSKFIIITNLNVKDSIPGIKLLTINDTICIFPETMTNVTNDSVNQNGADTFKVEFTNYNVLFSIEHYDNDNSNTPTERFGISFKSTTLPWSSLKDNPIGYQMKENSYNIILNDNVQLVGAPIGALAISMKESYVDKIAVVEKNKLLRDELYYVLINNIKSDMASPIIEFAEEEFASNKKDSKFNLLLNLDSSVTNDFSGIIKEGKKFDGTKQILYLYDKTTLKDDTGKNLTLSTDGYADFEYILDKNEFQPIDKLLETIKPENSIVVNKIERDKNAIYSVFRKDYDVAPSTLLTLQQNNQLQFTTRKFENEKTIININTRNNQNNLSFDISKKSTEMFSCVKGSFLEISTFLELVISSKELTLKNDVFIIVINIIEDIFTQFIDIFEVLKASVPCTTYFMKALNYLVLTNTSLNFDDDKIYSKKETFQFINSKDYTPSTTSPPKYNYIIKETFELIPQRSSSQVLTASYRVVDKQKYFSQLQLVNASNDFKVTANKGITNDYPIVNFMLLTGVEDSEVGYIASAYEAGIMDQTLVVVCYNDIDYTVGRPCTVIRKHLAVIYPKTFNSAKIDYNDSYYTVKMDDGKSNALRYLEFIYVKPNTNLDETRIHSLSDERMFVVNFLTPKVGDPYSDLLGVVLNDVCEFKTDLYTYKNLSDKLTPKLYQWITTTNKYITYLRPIDREILNGGSLRSETKVFLIVNIIEPLHDFEKINLVVQLLRGSIQCCQYVIMNNSTKPTELQNIEFTHKMGLLNSRIFHKADFNYIIPNSRLSPTSATYKLSDSYYYQDTTQRGGVKDFSVNPQDTKLLLFNNKPLGTNSTFLNKIESYPNRFYSNVHYNLWICYTDEINAQPRI